MTQRQRCLPRPRGLSREHSSRIHAVHPRIALDTPLWAASPAAAAPSRSPRLGSGGRPGRSRAAHAPRGRRRPQCRAGCPPSAPGPAQGRIRQHRGNDLRRPGHQVVIDALPSGPRQIAEQGAGGGEQVRCLQLAGHRCHSVAASAAGRLVNTGHERVVDGTDLPNTPASREAPMACGPSCLRGPVAAYGLVTVRSE